jgi:CRISPR/Cas system-associated exonuclease Cas4 (RecB family)
MVELPTPDPTLARLIYDQYEKREAAKNPRFHLGASSLGSECRRAIWYEFRWADLAAIDGRILRMFESGHLQEPRVVHDLRSVGLEVHAVDPDTGAQIRFNNGHMQGSCDGVVRGVPEAPKTTHLLEIKGMNDKNFKAIVKSGVKEAQPKYYVQMQVYMRAFRLSRSLLVVVNKNTDELHFERVNYDERAAIDAVRAGNMVIQSSLPPTRLSDDPAMFKCKMCSFSEICHFNKKMTVSCRTCKFSQPMTDPVMNGQWRCTRFDHLLTNQAQIDACPSHTEISND